MLQRLLLGLIKLYSWSFSIFCANCCRFYPSCSQYATEAIASKGGVYGLWLTAKRIVRCHPWCHGGYDPVP